jgi:hypothetical protein
MTSQARKDRLAARGIIVTDSRDNRRLARSLTLGDVHYDAGHPCAIVRRVSGICIDIMIEGRQFTVDPKAVMR